MGCDIYVRHLETVDSTNRYARDESSALWLAAGNGDIVAVTAGHQTAGRGQRGNSWQSGAGENLLLTLLVRPGCPLGVTSQFLLSQATALAVHSAMKRYGIDTKVKWPNDIYAGERKLAGILIELDYSGKFAEQAIIGIGLNVNQIEFPVMERVPVSMKMLCGKEFEVSDVLGEVLRSFINYSSILNSGDCETLASMYSSLLFGLGEERCFVDPGGAFKAVVEGVEPSGHLLLRREDGTLTRYAFKEVELLL